MIPSSEPKKPHLVVSPDERERFLRDLVDRSSLFLEREVSVPVKGVILNPHTIDKLDLESITSILTVEDLNKMIVAFSFQRPLLDTIFRVYSEGLRIDPTEYTALLEETAGDMINIVVGNALSGFQKPGYAFALSTPIIINEAKSILRYKKSELVTARISTDSGTMIVLCITPGAYYDTRLNIEEPE